MRLADLFPIPRVTQQRKLMQHYCFLHIGKTAGTALRAVITQHKEAHPEVQLDVFTHEHKLPVLCEKYPKSGFIFFVRDPIERFVSGFNSRLRLGRPRYNVPWTEAEAAAFDQFPTPNRLGEALSPEHTEWPAAESAMDSIYHARLSFVHYLHSAGFLESVKTRIVFIGDTRHFDRDLDLLKNRLHIDHDIQAPTDPIGAHRNPAELDCNLSMLAQTNLRRWYSDDYDIYDWCTNQRRILLGGDS